MNQASNNKKVKKVSHILGVVLLNIIANLITPDNDKFREMLKNIFWNHLGLTVNILSIIYIAYLLIKWKVEDFIQQRNKEFSDLKDNTIDNGRFDSTIKGITDSLKDMNNKLDKVSK